MEGAVEGDAEEEEDLEEGDSEDEPADDKARISKVDGKKRKSGRDDEHDAGGDGGRDGQAIARTPSPRRRPQASSSPFPINPSSSVKDYSSDLDFSSPPDTMGRWTRNGDDDNEDEDEASGNENQGGNGSKKRGRGTGEADDKRKAKRRSERPKRTRVYEVVGVVRRKVVFALR